MQKSEAGAVAAENVMKTCMYIPKICPTVGGDFNLLI